MQFQGWRVVAAAAVAQGLAVGFTMGTFGIFLEPMEVAFGASRASVSWGLAGMNLVMNLAMPLVGGAMDRGSIRRIMMVGVVLNSVAFAWVAIATELWEMLAAYALLASLGTAMFGPLASSTLVANWFDLQRGRALGIVNTGGPIGVALAAPLTSWSVIELGFRATLMGYALITLVVALPVVWFVIVSRPLDVQQSPDGSPLPDTPAPASAPDAEPATSAGALARSRSFWGIAIPCGFPIAASIVLTAHLVAFTTGLGADAQSASLLLSVQAAAAIGGTLLFGWLADRVALRPLLWGSIGVQAGILCVFMLEPSFATLIPMVAIMGTCMGGMLPICGAMIGLHFGASAFGQVLGLIFVVSLPLAVSGPPAAGAIYDATGSYQLAFAALVALFALASATLLLQPTRRSAL
jgi:MFS family permease